ncbi:MAG: phage tail protein [Anaerolineales bacterium]|nr:phage tail protein [Anaerolineales bacterium]
MAQNSVVAPPMPSGREPILRPEINGYEPFASYRFLVRIGNVPVGAFLDCKMPTISWSTQEVKEGGQNAYTHELIGQRKKASLVLKRGVAVTSVLTDWYRDTLEQRVRRETVVVSLLNSFYDPVITWNIAGAYPIKWQGPKLDTKAKTIAIDTITLSCGLITVEDPLGR